jgi:hypothetical protein
MGAVLYELLVGKPPYQGSSREEIIQSIRSGPPTPIAELNSEAFPALAQIAATAMARELRHRYAHISCLIEDLQAVQQGRSPPNAGLRLQAGPAANNRPSIGIWRRVLRLAGLVLILALGGYLWRSNNPPPPLSRPPLPGSSQITRTIQLPGVWNWSLAVLSKLSPRGAPKIFLPYEDTLLIVSLQGRLEIICGSDASDNGNQTADGTSDKFTVSGVGTGTTQGLRRCS